jgi:hypothetical protein
MLVRAMRAQWRPATASGAGKLAMTAAFRVVQRSWWRVPTYAGQTPAADVTFCPDSRWNSPPAIILIFGDGVCRFARRLPR